MDQSGPIISMASMPMRRVYPFSEALPFITRVPILIPLTVLWLPDSIPDPLLKFLVADPMFERTVTKPLSLNEALLHPGILGNFPGHVLCDDVDVVGNMEKLMLHDQGESLMVVIVKIFRNVYGNRDLEKDFASLKFPEYAASPSCLAPLLLEALESQRELCRRQARGDSEIIGGSELAHLGCTFEDGRPDTHALWHVERGELVEWERRLVHISNFGYEGDFRHSRSSKDTNSSVGYGA